MISVLLEAYSLMTFLSTAACKENEAWTTCPVCCFYDLLTNKRYGAGDFIDESNLNWVDLIEIAKYAMR